jgi:hypothetical protein
MLQNDKCVKYPDSYVPADIENPPSRRIIRPNSRLRGKNDILAPRLQKRPPGNAVTLERRAADGARINDDQCRRPAL